MPTQKIKITDKVSVPEADFVNAMFHYIKHRYESQAREIYLEADGVKEFVIVPNKRQTI